MVNRCTVWQNITPIVCVLVLLPNHCSVLIGNVDGVTDLNVEHKTSEQNPYHEENVAQIVSASLARTDERALRHLTHS